MNKTIVFVSCVVSIVLIHFGISTKTQVDNLKDELVELQSSNLDMKQQIRYKGSLIKCVPVSLSTEYGLLMNQVRILESYSGTNMDVQLEELKDVEDIADQYVNTEYRGVRGLKIKIMVDKFSKDTDMGAVLDDIHLLEKNTDFMATEIAKDNNSLIVKGEIYGL